MILRFVAIGTPAPMGSARGFPVRRKNGQTGVVIAKDNPATRSYQAVVYAAAADAYSGELLRGPLSVSLTFTFRRPAGHYGTGRNAERLRPGAPMAPANRGTGDVDKLCRATLDALEGVVYADDAQVVDLHALKRWGAPESVEVVVVTLEDEVA